MRSAHESTGRPWREASQSNQNQGLDNVAIYDYFNRRHCDRLESPATGNREKGASVHNGKARLLILALALIVSIVIVINAVPPAEARKGGHGDKGGHGGRGGDHGHGNHGGHGGDDNGDDNGDDGDNGDNGDGNGNGNGNGGGKSRGGDRGGGGECASVDGVNPCIMARPKIDRGPTEIAPGVFQYYGAFGQVIGTSTVTRYDDQLELDLEVVTSSPAPVPVIVEPVAIVPRETIQEPEVRKRTILPPEKSADPILDVLIIQALERPEIEPELVIVPVQSLPPCQCLP